jgi:uncharacterized protein (TIGR03435 family)
MSEHTHYRSRETRKPHIWKVLILLPLALLIATLCSTWIRAQSSPAQSFDIISVKLNHSINSGTALRDGTHGTPGHFGTTNLSLRDVIEWAYGVREGQIEGLPAWADSEKYDIDAKVDDATAEQERSLSRDQETKLTFTRVQALLADRFKVLLHHETKNMPVLLLTVAKGGLKFGKTAAVPEPGDAYPVPPGLMMRVSGAQWILTSNEAPLSVLVSALSGQPEVSGRILLDQTGLTGKYTFTLQWERQNLSGGPGPVSDTAGSSLFTALQQQLGLRLESAKAPVDVLVIDHVEEPSPN